MDDVFSAAAVFINEDTAVNENGKSVAAGSRGSLQEQVRPNLRTRR